MRSNLVTLLMALLISGAGLASTALAQDGDPMVALEEKLAKIDMTDPDQVFGVAEWASQNPKSSKVRREGRKLMKEVLELDEDHPGARNALGYVKVAGEWVKGKDAEKAILEAKYDELKDQGYIKFKNGLIKKSERSRWNSKWEKDDELMWRSPEEVMAAKGYVLYQGEWLKLSDDDRARMQHHRKMTGDDILVITTDHFVLHLMVSAKWMRDYAELAEATYAWYSESFGLPKDYLLFRNRLPRPHLWSFQTSQQFQDWVTTYSEEYQFDDDDKKQFRENPSGWLLRGKCIGTIVAKQAEDVEHTLVHNIGSLMVTWHTLVKTAPWLVEAFSHLAEHVKTKDELGVVNCSSLSRYGNGGGIASKEFNTKDGRPQAKTLVKTGDDIPIMELTKLPLNSLSSDHLSQGFSVVEWLYNNNREALVKFLNGLRDFQPPEHAKTQEEVVALATEAAIGAALGVSPGEFDKMWREYVKKTYK